jgi:hypothetical protein
MKWYSDGVGIGIVLIAAYAAARVVWAWVPLP